MRMIQFVPVVALIMSAVVVPDTEAYYPSININYFVYYVNIHFHRRRREVSDIIGLDRTEMEEACGTLGKEPQGGLHLDLELMEQLFRAVDQMEDKEGDGVLDDAEVKVFIDSLDTLDFCSKKAAGGER